MDEDGPPLAGARVVINGVVGPFEVRVTTVSTDGQGRYEADFDALRNGYRGVVGLTDIATFAYAHDDSGEYEEDLRFFTSSTSTVVGDFRLHRRVRLGAGESSTVTYRPDDGVCNGDASVGFNDLCRYVRIAIPADGTLTVSATPSNGGTVPDLLVIGDPISESNACPCGAGTVSYPVKAGTESLVAITIRRGFQDHRSYAVTTVFRADNQ